MGTVAHASIHALGLFFLGSHEPIIFGSVHPRKWLRSLNMFECYSAQIFMHFTSGCGLSKTLRVFSWFKTAMQLCVYETTFEAECPDFILSTRCLRGLT
jgi:hypothetical protein